MEQFEIHFENVSSMENQEIPKSSLDMERVPFEAIQNSL